LLEVLLLFGNNMLQNKAQAILSNLGGRRRVIADVNWDKDHKDCIKFTIGKSEAIIPRAELFQLLFTVSNAEQQAEMMTVKKEEVRPHARKHMVKLTKDMKAGEIMNVHCEVNIPLILEESFKQEFIKEGKEIHPSHLSPISVANKNMV